MKNAYLLAIGLHLALAAVLYANTTTPTPTTNLAPEDTPVAKADYPEQGAFFCLYKSGAEIALNGKTYFLQGQTTVDQFGGAATIIESPTGNAVTILPDGSTDLYMDGVQYTFRPE